MTLSSLTSALEIFTISILVPRHLTFHIYRDPNDTIFAGLELKLTRTRRKQDILCSAVVGGDQDEVLVRRG